MAKDGASVEIRVVRCPKCEKFLPELPNFSIYICGGCGATLQAQKQNPVTESSVEKSDGESVKYLELLESGSVKKSVVSGTNSKTSQKGKSCESRRAERSSTGEIASDCSNSVSPNKDNGIQKQPSILKPHDPPKENGLESTETNYRRVLTTIGSVEANILKEKGESPKSTSVRGRVSRSPMKGTRSKSYPDEGPSARNDADGPSRVGNCERDRAELLRMLDELRVQVQQSCEGADRQNGNAGGPSNRVADPLGSYSPRDRSNWLPQGSSSLNRNTSRHTPNLYSNMTTKHDVHGYEEPIPHGRTPIYSAGHFAWRNHDPYGLIGADPLVSFHHEGFYHQPACTCLHCHGTPAILNHQTVPYLVNDRPLYPMETPAVFGPWTYNTSSNNAARLRSRQRAMFSKKHEKHCEPLAGAAPFTVCYNCHELLRLPRKSTLSEKSQFKMRCGSCSQAIVINIDGSELDVSSPALISHPCFEHNNDSSADEKFLPPYSFSANKEVFDKEQQLNLNESVKMQGLSSSLGMSSHQQSPGEIDSQKDVLMSSELQSQGEVIPRVPSLPLCEHFEYSLSDKVAEGSGKGNGRARSEQEKIVLLAESFKQNSIKDVLVATEMDLPVDEYPDHGLSQDSLDINEDEQIPKTRKGGDSFFANLVKKKSFKAGNCRSRVFINGHPISDRAVKKAEKQAGPIYPGDYWYDYRAGFWGVMGRPCLGIIPPFIGEFTYHMPKDCSGGNTDVLVNGRELHQKDLNLLVGRGLPDTRGRSYRIEISGRVWDESSGEELYSLGKLAPTVEKMNHGFGMRIPRAIA